MNKKMRIVKLDIARTFAILCVILCHCVEVFYKKNFFVNNLSGFSMILFHTIGRLGVPIFLFLSGALLLKKNIDSDENIFNFYKQNLLPLLLVTEIWIVIYNLFFGLTNQNNYVTFENIMKEFLFTKQVPIPSMWYMPMILGTYIGIPFMAKIVKTFHLKSLCILLSAIFVVNLVWFIYPFRILYS